MFTATISADRLAPFTDSLTTLVDECKLHLDEDELQARAADPANVGMVDVSLEASAFEAYEADGGLIGVDLTRFEDIIGMADSGDLVNLQLNEETRKLEIQIEGLEYTLALIDPDSIRQEPDIPDLELVGNVVLEGKQIQKGVKAADLVSDHISLGFDVDNREFYFDAEGDTDDTHLSLTDEDLIDGVCEDSTESLFSLDYLKDLTKPVGGSTEVELEFGDELPLKMHFGEESISTTFMLAPRIQS